MIGHRSTRAMFVRMLPTAAMLASIGLGGAAAAENVLFGSVDTFSTHADLNIDGEYVYAVNFSANAQAFTVNGVTFKQHAQTSGLSVDANGLFNNWGSRPEYGNAASDDGLEDVAWDIAYGRWGADIGFDAQVQAGTKYQLQLLFSENYWTEVGRRAFDVVIEGLTAIDEFDVFSHMAPVDGAPTRGVVFTYTFVASDNLLNIDLIRGSSAQDANPFINGMTLKVVPAPGAAMLASLGALFTVGGRRRR